MDHPEKVEKAIRYLKKGHSRADAARLSGVGSRTLFRWIERGRAGEQPYVAILARIRAAEACAVDVQIANLNRGAKKGSVQAAVVLLRAYRPKRFADKQKVEVSSGGAELPTDAKERAALFEFLASEARKEAGAS